MRGGRDGARRQRLQEVVHLSYGENGVACKRGGCGASPRGGGQGVGRGRRSVLGGQELPGEEHVDVHRLPWGRSSLADPAGLAEAPMLDKFMYV